MPYFYQRNQTQPDTLIFITTQTSHKWSSTSDKHPTYRNPKWTDVSVACVFFLSETIGNENKMLKALGSCFMNLVLPRNKELFCRTPLFCIVGIFSWANCKCKSHANAWDKYFLELVFPGGVCSPPVNNSRGQDGRFGPWSSFDRWYEGLRNAQGQECAGWSVPSADAVSAEAWCGADDSLRATAPLAETGWLRYL